MTKSEIHDLWVATNKEHGQTCRECKHSEFVGDRFWGCIVPLDYSLPETCLGVIRHRVES